MHTFSDLIKHSTTSTLNALKEANEKLIETLQTSGATSLVKGLQMVQLQKAIFAVGMFSMFEAVLQDGLTCKNGFLAASEILDDEGEARIKERFSDLCLAINVLKHGRGRSYDTLVLKATNLPFRVKLPDEPFFDEGNVSEISTLVEVDDAFVMGCAEVIRDVSRIIKRTHSDFFH